MTLSHKSINSDLVEFKFSQDKPGFFSGYASKFNGVDSYGDTILPGAYKKTLQNRQRPVMMLFNHTGDPIGKWTLMREDSYGLYVEGQLTPGHSKAADVHASMLHGTTGGMSIGFRIVKAVNKPSASNYEDAGGVDTPPATLSADDCDDAGDDESGENLTENLVSGRVISEIDLVEVSVVTQPADLGATINNVKALIEEADDLKSLERWLRDAANISKAEAKQFIAKVKSFDSKREALDQGESVAALNLALAFQGLK